MTVVERQPGADQAVTILGGSGALGAALSVRFSQANVAVTIGSRDGARAADAAERLMSDAGHGAPITGTTNAEAAQANPVVILCVPFAAQAPTLQAIRDVLDQGQLLVDATVPLAPAIGGKPTRTLGVWQGSAAEQAQELMPDGVCVVSALHTVSAAHLRDLGHALDEDVLVCGRRRADKQRVARLIERIDGLRPVDAGPLEQARIVEQLTALLIGINGRYRTHAGLRVTGLPDAELFPPFRPAATAAT